MWWLTQQTQQSLLSAFQTHSYSSLVFTSAVILSSLYAHPSSLPSIEILLILGELKICLAHKLSLTSAVYGKIPFPEFM